jgi:hypothetical protein
MPVVRNGSYSKAAGDSSVAAADGLQAGSADLPGPVSPQGWDPFEVWLTRVKQPRDQGKRRQSRPVAVGPVTTTDPGETARRVVLSGARPR